MKSMKSDETLTVSIRKSKTDVLHNGATVLMTSTGTDSCPVKIVKQYLQLVNLSSPNISSKISQFIFRNIQITYANERLYAIDKPISYSRAREELKAHMEIVDTEGASSTWHCFRVN